MEIEKVRADFARRIASKAGLPQDGEIAAAFAEIPREDFIAPPPWRVFDENDSALFPVRNPEVLYQDSVVQLKRETGINNGQPSLHALCFGALRIRKGETAIHVGAGMGYYTAILAKLVGEEGHVDAYEIEHDLAEAATKNLSRLPQVRVHASSGTEGPLPECDVLYVSAGATSPLDVWLNALKRCGRLLFPLTPDEGTGGMLLVTRVEGDQFAARFLCEVKFIGCVGARDEVVARRLHEAFARGRVEKVRSLRRDNSPEESAWFSGDGWWLSTSEPSRTESA
jgi:protein-L-isoaspartate(D-aspartate) O-methyltransferase